MSYKYQQLDAWKEAKNLAVLVYRMCDKYPDYERFGLFSQSTRAAVSIAANIAEGCSRSSNKDFVRFLEIAVGSGYELETLLAIAYERKYIENADYQLFNEQINKVLAIIAGLKRKLRN